MKKIIFTAIFLFFIFGLTSCKKCREEEVNNVRYVGVYLQVSKNVKERNLNDVNYKAYINEDGGISTINNSFEYNITSNLYGPTHKEDGEFIIDDFGIAASVFINTWNKDVDTVEIFPIVYDENEELVVLDKEVATIKLVDQEVKGTTFEKSYEYKGQKYHLKVSIKITKKIVG